MNLGTVMQQLADRLATITGLRAYGWPVNQVVVPAAVVSYPEAYSFDATYARGMDRVDLPVITLVGKVAERSARDNLAKYCDGTGAASIKQVLESGTYTAFDTCHVARVEFDGLTLGGVDYLAATFTVEITGKGN